LAIRELAYPRVVQLPSQNRVRVRVRASYDYPVYDCPDFDCPD